MGHDLYNLNGEAIANIVEDGSIYTWAGKTASHVDQEIIYGWNGIHLGWFVDGIIYNKNGLSIGFTIEKCPFATRVSPVKSTKHVRAVRYARRCPSIKPYYKQSLVYRKYFRLFNPWNSLMRFENPAPLD